MSVLKNVFVSVCAMAVLTACTTPSGGKHFASSGESLSPTARLFGDYLAASYANQLGDAKARSHYYSRAFALEPGNMNLALSALVSALSAGELDLARTLAIEIRTLELGDGLSRAVLGAHALANEDYVKAMTFFGDAGEGSALDDINGLMRGWAQVGLGEQDVALDTFTQLGGGKYFELMGDLQKAKLYAQIGDTENANTYFSQVDEVGISAIESTLSQVRFHVAQGDKDAALAKLDAFAKENGGALTGPIRLYIDTLKAGGDIDTNMTPAQSASRALTEPAFGYYAVQKHYEAAEMFLRLALELDPKNDKARLFLGSVLEDITRQDDALDQYERIDAKSPYTVSARLSEANLLFIDDQDAAAIAKLETVHATHPTRVTQDSLGRAYLIMEDYGNALPYYDALIADMTDAELQENPQPRYLRGICLERLDRWQEAVVEFEFVLKHQPENADALNYLGYTWVDKGVELTKAFGMIRNAVELEPKSGAIIDSLGWAHYKMGQYAEARVQLEDAVERSPSSATIVDHLGDVYWKVGRIREAGYQWQRAIALDPTDEERRVLKAKLEGGLAAGEAIKKSTEKSIE